MFTYVDVILPLPLRGTYTYLANSVHHTQKGSRVIVQFGKKKFYTAIVHNVYESKNEKDGIKEITAVLDNYPIVTELQLSFWEWIANYYMCTLGDVYKAALPAALKLESETYILLNPDFEMEEQLSNNEQSVFTLLHEDKVLSIADLSKLTKIQNVIPIIKSLVDKGAALLSEEVKKDYTPKTNIAIKLAKDFSKEELNNISDQLKRAPKQQKLLQETINLLRYEQPLFKKYLLEKAGFAPNILNELVKKDILQTYDYKVDRINYGDVNIEAAYTLNTYQQEAYDEIKTSFVNQNTTLLFGVTSSGKTEIYIQLIKDAISRGKQVLYLLPEIALTTQITDRLKAVFGNKLAVYHSKFNDNERAETWNKLLQNEECQIVLGARSAIFLPFRNLELIIVDEEHEASYKQQDPAPRYNARNAAIMLGNMCDAKVLLGTATPAIETYYNALNGRYGLVRLTKRYENIALPKIEIVNTKELRRKKQMKSILSPPLIKHMQRTFDAGEQVILFQNRRGFASMLECKTCSWTPHCKHCDVSLTYHKGQNNLVCHYCGTSYPVPTICPECNTPTLDSLGYGTERIEEEVLNIFPMAAIGRMDLDTTRSRKAYERIIDDFECNRTNILIGTQMVSKGLDFDNVSVVGILNADNLLNYPDFRAHERAFQLMTQVSGRAGRKNKQGLVLLQTAHPSHPLINFVKQNDYESFFKLQLEERLVFCYPPYFRLISIIIRGKDYSHVEYAAKNFAQSLRHSFGERVVGPAKPPVSRIQTLYIQKILLKVENQASIKKIREQLELHQAKIFSKTSFSNLILHYDVDPV